VDHLGEDIAVHPYASVDTSARMPQFYLEDLVAQLGADRVIFGTGMPLNYPDTALQMIMAAELTDDDRRKIFSQNAKRLFAIEFDRETEL
jgi:predicted TIM-barrel fold metal-dependent hydrolase